MMNDKQVKEVTGAVAKRFGCFGQGSEVLPDNPISLALQSQPLVFCAGVDVEKVVKFVIEMKEVDDIERIQPS
jgi:hypothetical protein